MLYAEKLKKKEKDLGNILKQALGKESFKAPKPQTSHNLTHQRECFTNLLDYFTYLSRKKALFQEGGLFKIK